MIQLKVTSSYAMFSTRVELINTPDNDELHRQFGGSRGRMRQGHANEETRKDW